MNSLSSRICCAMALVVGVIHASQAHSAAWVNVTGNLAALSSECGNLSLVSAKPGSATIIAGVAKRGLFTNTGGDKWSPLGTGARSEPITNRPSWIAYDPDDPDVFWESGIYNDSGVFKTTDGGATFRHLGAITHNDYVSVDFSDPQRRLLLAGGHEQAQTVHRSTNGGSSWKNIGAAIPANTNMTTHPLIVAAQTYVVNAQSWGEGTAGIYRTTDGGASWQRVSSSGPKVAPLVLPDRTILWPADGGLLQSRDSGSTWTLIGSGLDAVTPVLMEDGRIAAVGGNRIAISGDGGVTWTPFGDVMPYTPSGFTYSSGQRAFFIWHFDCGNAVLPDAIMSTPAEALDWILKPLAEAG